MSVGSVSETYTAPPELCSRTLADRAARCRSRSATRRATICESGGGCPMNKLYRDTVTLYHADMAAQTVVRTVLRGVCWQQGRRELPDAGGTRRGAALLVVIPETTARYGADYTLEPGDRLFPGVGPALTWADWPGFVPAAVEGAALVQYVLPMRLRGKPHHVEAGAWWNGSGTGVRSLTR